MCKRKVKVKGRGKIEKGSVKQVWKSKRERKGEAKA